MCAAHPDLGVRVAGLARRQDEARTRSVERETMNERVFEHVLKW
jgi:hypothetical protein